MGQEDAFLKAFDEYADALFRHCYFRVADREQAKDLVADAFMRTWDYVTRGNRVDDFKPFLYRTLNRLIIDWYRKKKHESLDALLDEHDVPEAAFPELVAGSREELELSLDATQVPKLITHMPHTYREVIVMRYMDGLMPAEIAELLGESVNNVSVRIHRGIKWLAHNIDTTRTYRTED